MRITSGKYKGIRIEVPKSAKPVKGIVLNSIFSTLGDLVRNASCADLFEGRGALGLEALSRQALHCDFVEIDKKAVKILLNNIQKLKVSNIAKVVSKDTLKFIGSASSSYDIIFMDPPYDAPVKHVIKTIHYICNKNALIVYTHNAHSEISLPEELNLIRQRKFGKTVISYIKYV